MKKKNIEYHLEGLFGYINIIYYVTKKNNRTMTVGDLFVILDQLNTLLYDEPKDKVDQILPRNMSERLSLFRLISLYYSNGIVDSYFVSDKCKYDINKNKKEDIEYVSLFVESFYVKKMLEISDEFGLNPFKKSEENMNGKDK